MSTAPATAETPLHDRVYGRLSKLAAAAMLPWLVISIVTCLMFGSPNTIVTPLMWLILIAIWSYPLVLLLGKSLAWVMRVYGQYDRANFVMSLPSSMGVFLFSMLIVPCAVIPIFTDGYFGLMASCLLSIFIASYTMGRLRR